MKVPEWIELSSLDDLFKGIPAKIWRS